MTIVTNTVTIIKMSKKIKTPQVRYEIITQKDNETGDLIIPLPIPVLKQMGWKEGDNLEIDVDVNGQIYLKKANI